MTAQTRAHLRSYPFAGKITQSSRIRTGALPARIPVPSQRHHLLLPCSAGSHPSGPDDGHHRRFLHAAMLRYASSSDQYQQLISRYILHECPNPSSRQTKFYWVRTHRRCRFTILVFHHGHLLHVVLRFPRCFARALPSMESQE